MQDDAMTPGAPHDPFMVRLGEGASLIDLGGMHVDPCDVLAVADSVCDSQRAIIVLSVSGSTHLSTYPRAKVVALMEAEMNRRADMIRARMPKPPTEAEIADMQRQQQRMVIEGMTEAMKAARRAADPDGDAPWKQGQ